MSSSQISTSSLKFELRDEQLSISTLFDSASEIYPSSYSGFNLALICYSESVFISHGKVAFLFLLKVSFGLKNVEYSKFDSSIDSLWIVLSFFKQKFKCLHSEYEGSISAF